MATKKLQSLTYQQSQGARAALTLSQKNVIDQTGIQAYKIKQFEAGRYRLDAIDQKKLRDFYEDQGVDFEQIDQDLQNKQESEFEDSNQQRGITPMAGAGFLISSEVTQSQVDMVLDRMEANDKRIAELVETAYTSGMFGGVSDDSEAAVRELFGILAESQLLFRRLQGKNIVSKVTGEPKTVGEKLSQWVQESPAFEVFGVANVKQKTKQKAGKKTDEVTEESEG